MIKAILRTPAHLKKYKLRVFSKILTSLVDMKLKPRQTARFSNVFI